ncbi:methyl-accepting chemotaxis protein [Burkholderia sp. OK233]|nr:methyl-accepting chemotaxis protein [Burkholderia sp. OK233]
MSRFGLSLKAQLALTFAAFALLCGAIAAVGMNGITVANARSTRFYEEVTLPAQYLESAYRLQSLQAMQLLDALLLKDEAERKQRFDTLDKLEKPTVEQYALFMESAKTASARSIAADIMHDRELFKKEFDEAVRLVRGGNAEEGTKVLETRARPYGIALGDKTQSVIATLNAQAQGWRIEDAATNARIERLILSILLIGGAIVGCCVWFQMRSMSGSLESIRDTLGAINQTLDLTRRVSVRKMDEIGQTSTAFNSLVERFSGAISSVRMAMDSVSAVARQIAADNADLSARTDEQAASLEETASSMVQLTEAVTQNADNARAAKMLAVSATGKADDGRDAVQAMVQTIRDVSDSSKKVSEITGLIESIAFQTNILALNAAVEAARAGEEGRGFAVVASEVRSLAQRSAAAAKEIKVLIGSSVAMIESGSKQAVNVAATMTEVTHSIKQVSDIVGEIAAASEEQSRGIEQVNQAVGQMDVVTQRNAALVGQAASAAQFLEERAGKLTDAVSVFRVTDAAWTDAEVSQ